MEPNPFSPSNMVESIRLIQMLFGIALALGVLGWCSWRLLILTGLIRSNRTPNKGAQKRRRTKGAEPGEDQQARQRANKPASGTVSKQVWYSASRKPD